MSVAPYDVRQGNFVGAGVNTVTRSGTNRFTRLVLSPLPQRGLRRHRSGGARRSTPAPSRSSNTGGWAGGPIIKNKLFAFGNYENAEDTRPLTTFRANTGRRAGRRQHDARARVRSDRAQRVPVEAASATTPARSRTSTTQTPAKPFLIKSDYNLNNIEQGQLPLQPARLEHRHQPVELDVARLRPPARHAPAS